MRKIIIENNRTDIKIPENRVVSAGAYVFCKNPNGKWFLLSAKRAGHNPRFQGGKYNIPVGMKEYYGESSVVCAQREVWEETGLKIPIEKFHFVGYDEWSYGKFGANYIVKLDGTLGDYEIGPGDWENKKYKWIPIENVNNLKWAYRLNDTAMELYQSNVAEGKRKIKLVLKETQLKKIIKESIKYILKNRI